MRMHPPPPHPRLSLRYLKLASQLVTQFRGVMEPLGSGDFAEWSTSLGPVVRVSHFILPRSTLFSSCGWRCHLSDSQSGHLLPHLLLAAEAKPLWWTHYSGTTSQNKLSQRLLYRTRYFLTQEATNTHVTFFLQSSQYHSYVMNSGFYLIIENLIFLKDKNFSKASPSCAFSHTGKFTGCGNLTGERQLLFVPPKASGGYPELVTPASQSVSEQQHEPLKGLSLWSAYGFLGVEGTLTYNLRYNLN